MAVLNCQLLVLPFSPRVDAVTNTQSWSSLKGKVNDPLQSVLSRILDKGLNDLLLKRRQGLRDLSVDLVVLLPQL